MAIISTSIVSTLFIYFFIFTVNGIVYFYKAEEDLSFGVNYKFWILLLGITIYLVNYYLFIKSEIFLKQDFKKDRKGGLVIIFIVLSIGILFVIVANKNREKIFKEREKARIESNQ